MSKALMRAAGVFLAAWLAMSTPAQAQFSEAYRFLEAVRKKDGQAVTDALAEPGSTLINTRDVSSGESPLHIVVARRDVTWVNFLIGKGANVNIRDAHGVSPLVLACNLNFVEGVDALLAKGALVDDAGPTGETPLIAAVHSRNAELMRVLLHAGANPDRSDNSGRTARDYAALDGHNSPLVGLIEREARARAAAGQTPPVYGPSR